MARISGVDLPREKRVEIGLTYIYGIGLSSAKRILAEANVDPDTRVRDLTDDEVKRISAVINDTQVVEGDLRREIALNIKRLKEIGLEPLFDGYDKNPAPWVDSLSNANSVKTDFFEAKSTAYAKASVLIDDL